MLVLFTLALATQAAWPNWGTTFSSQVMDQGESYTNLDLLPVACPTGQALTALRYSTIPNGNDMTARFQYACGDLPAGTSRRSAELWTHCFKGDDSTPLYNMEQMFSIDSFKNIMRCADMDMVMSSFRFIKCFSGGVMVEYTCDGVGLGKLSERRSASTSCDKMGDGEGAHVAYLDRHDMACGRNEFLVFWGITRCSTELGRVDYSCQTPAEPELLTDHKCKCRDTWTYALERDGLQEMTYRGCDKPATSQSHWCYIHDDDPTCDYASLVKDITGFYWDTCHPTTEGGSRLELVSGGVVLTPIVLIGVVIAVLGLVVGVLGYTLVRRKPYVDILTYEV